MIILQNVMTQNTGKHVHTNTRGKKNWYVRFTIPCKGTTPDTFEGTVTEQLRTFFDKEIRARLARTDYLQGLDGLVKS